MALLLKHQTVAELVTRARVAYMNADPDTLVKISKFVLGRIAAGDITDAQFRTAYGRTASQWTTLKTKMQKLVDAHNTVNTAVGE